MLFKIQDNELVSQPLTLQVGDQLFNPVNTEVLLANGWKPLILEPTPEIKWFESTAPKYVEKEDAIIEIRYAVPIEGIRTLYSNVLLSELNRALENDFIWGGCVVKLSESNQKDYLASFSVATYTPEMFIPMEYTFKDNVKYMMNTLDEIVQFTNKALQFVSKHLEIYRTEIDHIKPMNDSQLYDYLKTIY